MTEHPADTILNFIFSKNGSIGNSVIAKETGVDAYEIAKIALTMQEMFPAWFVIANGSGEDKVRIGINPRHKTEVNTFLLRGGFTKIYETINHDMQQLIEQHSSDLEKLKGDVQELESRPIVRKSTRAIAIVSLFVSLTVAMFELWKTLWQHG
jgi:hypothetical protein